MSSLFSAVCDHEQVLLCSDRPSGLHAIIAIYSTALGPSLGGTRFHPYADEEVALADALALSRAMAYKAACAGLDLGGGKAVIIGDPAVAKSEPLLRAFGRHVASLGGRYITACDVGTYVADMDVIARETRWVTGRSPAHGGSGDSGVLTAYGVFEGMRAAARHRWGTPSLAGRRVAVSGVGKVGRRLVGHLLDSGASVVAGDVDPVALARLRVEFPAAETVPDPDDLLDLDIDVYAPCALGGALSAETVRRLRAGVVCGGANNQLAQPEVGRQLADAGVLYAPDFVVNAGGLIQVADEIEGYSPERARARAAQIFDTTSEVFRLAEAEEVTPTEAAERLAERRMTDVGRLRGILLP
ncbi:valine dehydrogenase (NAD) [Frankia casuarinae]|jgi:valine dehydrogenase (NAD+)|uniref:Valine dehydrogenase (NAD) n=2 Tax=Frankia casuarinae (strain DSM 45818 / CECT 9043 / HFP020203 / CcI3) TaxID=106370 RepID=Q2JGV1_FRACC|nr:MULTISPECIES: Glu/Leu/Phe/Val dehydrogenase dimerization domain-containing protein [Frankia]ABD09491.1 valine dehydrogenase (NAD) [Frankia casuarinae]ETA02824.1 valine dehydrogenase (NAD) [Frankia sp. CcI6]EYT94103.1 valine dehydrogenase (NAD) [Frankia casuarinae]KDA44293.1 valine dehydrogenase (NAD) [Frankia sp. BMG5.23]KFB06740.1 valine dehydrogenase (NAD) [Frankia sp. Allo2]